VILFVPLNNSDDQLPPDRLLAFQTNGAWDCVECLSNSFQRVRVLAALTDASADLRDLKDELAIPRTSLQRNLALLEQHGWVKQIPAGYTTTIRGSLLVNVFLKMLRRVQRIETLTPFLDEVDLPTALDIDQLDEFRVTVPEPSRPHAPIIRLLDIVETADRMRAFSPVVAGLLAKHYYRPSVITGDHEFILSMNTVDAAYRPDLDDWIVESETDWSTRIEIRVYDGEFPYGLFVCEDMVALAAYDSSGRIQALVESESETTVTWGEEVYETYRHHSHRLPEMERFQQMHESGITD
jgi:predicted transcriptional regulator